MEMAQRPYVLGRSCMETEGQEGSSEKTVETESQEESPEKNGGNSKSGLVHEWKLSTLAGTRSPDRFTTLVTLVHFTR
jgi:hypothetical protein